jgi:hypothetical protein
MNLLADCRGRRIARIAIISTLAIGLFSGVLEAKTFKLKNASIVPGAAGEVKTGKDKNGNTKFSVAVKHLADPKQLTPPKSVYIVWIQSKDGRPESQGMLKVNKNLEGKLESTTPNKLFDLWVTAEDDATIKSPSGPEVVRANDVAP